MVYVNTPGGQKWRPTCTGSEVCMYVNVDLFIKQKHQHFCIPRLLCGVNVVASSLIVRYGCATVAGVR